MLSPVLAFRPASVVSRLPARCDACPLSVRDLLAVTDAKLPAIVAGSPGVVRAGLVAAKVLRATLGLVLPPGVAPGPWFQAVVRTADEIAAGLPIFLGAEVTLPDHGAMAVERATAEVWRYVEVGLTHVTVDPGDGSPEECARVLSVHCRRAPENPYPAQVEDALEAIRYASSCNGLLPESPQGLILAGDSAGGFVAFRSALALAEIIRLRGLLLFYPALEPDCSKSSFTTHARAPGLTAETMRQYWDALLGYDQGIRDGLELARADLRNLPPTTVIVAEQDPLRDDGTKLVRLLNGLTKPASCVVASGTTHGFCRVVQQDAGAMAWVEAGIAQFLPMLDRPG